MDKIGQSGGFLGRILGPLLKTGFLLMKNLLIPLAKRILIPIGLTAAASGTDAITQKKIHGSGTTALIILNEEMEDIIKIVKSLNESGLLIKGVSEIIKNEATEAASLLGNLLTGKGILGAGESTVRVGQTF